MHGLLMCSGGVCVCVCLGGSGADGCVIAYRGCDAENKATRITSLRFTVFVTSK